MNTVYADIVFAANFCIDYLLLYITARILHIKVTVLRMISSAVLGGLYAVISVLIPLNITARILSITAVYVLMVVFTFGNRPKKIKVRILIVFFLTSLLLGGLLSFLDMHFKIDGFSFMMMLILACIYGFSLPFVVSLFRADVVTKKIDVQITLCGITRNFVLICDSADFLIDPINNNPVILLCDECRNLFFINDDVKRHMLVVKTANGVDYVELFVPEAVVAKNGCHRVSVSVGFVKNNCFKEDGCDGILPSSLIDYL